MVWLLSAYENGVPTPRRAPQHTASADELHMATRIESWHRKDADAALQHRVLNFSSALCSVALGASPWRTGFISFELVASAGESRRMPQLTSEGC